MKKCKLSFFLLLFSLVNLIAQTELSDPFVFENARDLAFSDEYDSALVICDTLLLREPTNLDARLLKARIHGWKGEYDKARQDAASFYLSRPNESYGLFNALADIEYWSKQYNNALYVLELGLSVFPEDSTLLAKRERIFSLIAKKDSIVPGEVKETETAETVTTNTSTIAAAGKNTLTLDQDTISKVAYSGNDSLSLIDTLVPKEGACITLDYYFDAFNDLYKRRWNVFSLGTKLYTDHAIVLPKLSLGYLAPLDSSDEADITGQIESDFYYLSGSNYYLYFNAGFAFSELFPKYKLGFEYYTKYLSDMEVSLGARYMQWEQNIFYATLSVSKYFKNYWFSFRPYFPFRDFQATGAYVLSGRRYFEQNQYIGLSFVFGAAPDQSYDLFLDHGAYKSKKIIVSGNKLIKDRYRVRAAVSFSNEEYRLDLYQYRFDFNIGLDYCF